jgi:pimeloyl-ACP methyl ester carboxylesterase
MPYKTVDHSGTRSYATREVSREHIVPRDGTPPYYRERLAAKINGKTIREIFLYEPDTKEVPLALEIPTVKFGGLWTTGNLYSGEASATAQSGRRFVTFMTHRHVPLRVQLLDARHRKSPYLRTAQNGRAVIKAVIRHTGVDRVRASGHSYGGLTLPEMAAHCGEYVESMVLQDPSGIGPHDVRLGDLWSKELMPASSYFRTLEHMPPDTMKNVLRHITDNPVLSLREILGLRNPDSRPHLAAAREKGTRVGLLILGRSAIFNAANNRRIAESEGLFHLIDEVPGAYHIDPNLRPSPIVEAQNRMFDELARLGEAALVS